MNQAMADMVALATLGAATIAMASSASILAVWTWRLWSASRPARRGKPAGAVDKAELERQARATAGTIEP